MDALRRFSDCEVPWDHLNEDSVQRIGRDASNGASNGSTEGGGVVNHSPRSSPRSAFTPTPPLGSVTMEGRSLSYESTSTVSGGTSTVSPFRLQSAPASSSSVVGRVTTGGPVAPSSRDPRWGAGGGGGKTEGLKRKGPSKCPSGHNLRGFLTSHSRFHCDLCGRYQRRGGAMRGCRPCNYDICEPCDYGEGGIGKKGAGKGGGKGGGKTAGGGEGDETNTNDGDDDDDDDEDDDDDGEGGEDMDGAGARARHRPPPQWLTSVTMASLAGRDWSFAKVLNASTVLLAHLPRFEDKKNNAAGASSSSSSSSSSETKASVEYTGATGAMADGAKAARTAFGSEISAMLADFNVTFYQCSKYDIATRLLRRDSPLRAFVDASTGSVDGLNALAAAESTIGMDRQRKRQVAVVARRFRDRVALSHDRSFARGVFRCLREVRISTKCLAVCVSLCVSRCVSLAASLSASSILASSILATIS